MDSFLARHLPSFAAREHRRRQYRRGNVRSGLPLPCTALARLLRWAPPRRWSRRALWGIAPIGGATACPQGR